MNNYFPYWKILQEWMKKIHRSDPFELCSWARHCIQDYGSSINLRILTGTSRLLAICTCAGKDSSIQCCCRCMSLANILICGIHWTSVSKFTDWLFIISKLCSRTRSWEITYTCFWLYEPLGPIYLIGSNYQ